LGAGNGGVLQACSYFWWDLQCKVLTDAAQRLAQREAQRVGLRQLQHECPVQCRLLGEHQYDVAFPQQSRPTVVQRQVRGQIDEQRFGREDLAAHTAQVGSQRAGTEIVHAQPLLVKRVV